MRGFSIAALASVLALEAHASETATPKAPPYEEFMCVPEDTNELKNRVRICLKEEEGPGDIKTVSQHILCPSGGTTASWAHYRDGKVLTSGIYNEGYDAMVLPPSRAAILNNTQAYWFCFRDGLARRIDEKNTERIREINGKEIALSEQK